MAVISPNVVGPMQTGLGGLQNFGSQLLNYGLQQQQIEREDENLQKQREALIEKAQIEQQTKDKNLRNDLLNKKWETYMAKDPNIILKNPSVIRDIVSTGSELGLLDAENVSMELLSGMFSIPLEDVKMAQLNWDKEKFWAQFNQDERKMKASGESVPWDIKRDRELVDPIIETLINTPQKDRGKLIKENRWDSFINSYNEKIKPYGLTPINIKNIDKGDWNPFTDRYETEIGLSGTKEVPVSYTPLYLERMKANAASGNKDAQDFVKSRPDLFESDPQDMVYDKVKTSKNFKQLENLLPDLRKTGTIFNMNAFEAAEKLGYTREEIRAAVVNHPTTNTKVEKTPYEIAKENFLKNRN